MRSLLVATALSVTFAAAAHAQQVQPQAAGSGQAGPASGATAAYGSAYATPGTAAQGQQAAGYYGQGYGQVAQAQPAAPGQVVAPAPVAPEQVAPVSDWSIRVGAGTVYRPEYEGGDKNEFTFLPIVNISYRDIVFLDGQRQAIGANVVRNGPLRAGPLAKFRFGRDEDDSSKLRGMGSIDASFELGAFVEATFGKFVAGIDATGDIIGGHDGFVIEARAAYRTELGPRLRGSFGGSATWASTEYMQTYFGVSAAQSAGTRAAGQNSGAGYATYTAKQSIKDMGLNGSLTYMVTNNVDVTGFVGYKRLVEDAFDSPIVKDVGDENQYSVGAAVAYRF